MDYAVIRLQGQQFKVSKGDEILVGKMKSKKPEADVLLVSKDGKVSIGTPVVKSASVKLEVVSEAEKGEKLHVRKFKSKSRYRRTIGFRPTYTRLLVKSI